MDVGKGLRMRKQVGLTRGSGLYCAAASLKENMGAGELMPGGGASNRQPAPTPHPSTPSSPPYLLAPSTLISPCLHLSLSLPPWLFPHSKIPLARAHLHNGRFLKRPSPFEGSPHRSLAPASRGPTLLGSTCVGTYSIVMASNVCVFLISHPSSISSHPFKALYSVAKTYQAPTDPYPPFISAAAAKSLQSYPFTRTFLIQSVPSPVLPLDGLFPNPVRARPLLSTPH